jgi:hypothetical protein
MVQLFALTNTQILFTNIVTGLQFATRRMCLEHVHQPPARFDCSAGRLPTGGCVTFVIHNVTGDSHVHFVQRKNIRSTETEVLNSAAVHNLK